MAKNKKTEVYRPKTVANKKLFSSQGVIFECERDPDYGDLAVKMVHWPQCGMDEHASLAFGKWLIKRSKDIKADRARQVKMAKHRIKGALDLKVGDLVSMKWRGSAIRGTVTDLSEHGRFVGVNVILVTWEDQEIFMDRPYAFFADGRCKHTDTKPVLRKR